MNFFHAACCWIKIRVDYMIDVCLYFGLLSYVQGELASVR
jgi:hypothetical protein